MILPYSATQVGIQLSMPMLIGTLVQAILIYGVVVFFGIKFAEKADFQIK